MFLKNPRDIIPDKTVLKILLKCIACVLILYFFPIAIYPIIFWIAWLIFAYKIELKNTQTHIDASQQKIDNNDAKDME
jgi:hypothetical protein